MWTAKIAGGVLITASLISLPAAAEYYEPHNSDERWSSQSAPNRGYSDWADVVRVEPLQRSVQVSTPSQQCWDQPVKHRQAESSYHRGGSGHRSYTPVILGGILGGVVGNQFGKGSGNTLMTVAGALLGGSVGNDTQRHHRRHHRRAARETYTTYEKRCETTHTFHDEVRPDGYRVDYQYNGRTYSTHTARHPGEKIRVNVNVTPEG